MIADLLILSAIIYVRPGAIAFSTEHRVAGEKLLKESEALLAFQFRHIPELDGFREFAVLVVVVGHYLEFRLAPASPYFATLRQAGRTFVFRVERVLITGLLHSERVATDQLDFRRGIPGRWRTKQKSEGAPGTEGETPRFLLTCGSPGKTTCRISLAK
jgi:hypothetical protein